jgi:N-acetylneuraminate synthase
MEVGTMLIIGDIGINHNGSIGTAIKLMQAAKDAGFDVVKFQKRNPDVCVPEEQKQIIKNTIFGRMSYIDYKHRIEFGQKEYNMIDNESRRIGIKWTASVWDIDSLKFIMKYDVPFIKIPSACITDLDLLREVAKTNQKVIISTGMSTQEEIDIAVLILQEKELGILQCNSSYPSLPEEADMRYITTLKTMYPQHTIGYSGHGKTCIESIVAASLGAEIIEHHITLDKNMQGSDHNSSLDEREMRTLVNMLSIVDDILGSDQKIVYGSELEAKNKLRRI